jgi:hypothetical protein
MDIAYQVFHITSETLSILFEVSSFKVCVKIPKVWTFVSPQSFVEGLFKLLKLCVQ